MLTALRGHVLSSLISMHQEDAEDDQAKLPQNPNIRPVPFMIPQNRTQGLTPAKPPTTDFLATPSFHEGSRSAARVVVLVTTITQAIAAVRRCGVRVGFMDVRSFDERTGCTSVGRVRLANAHGGPCSAVAKLSSEHFVPAPRRTNLKTV